MIKEGTKKIRYGAFAGQDTLEEIIIPDSVTEIGGAAFRGCTALKKVVLPSKLKVLSQSIFEGCTSLSEIILPDSVTVIEDSAFAECSSLKNLELPEGIFFVAPYAFRDAACEGKVVYKGPCKRLYGNTLFTKKDRQTHIEIPEGVISLEDACFRDYTDLETVVFPKSLKMIGSNCFNGCSGLKEIHFHEGMEIDWYGFEKCDSLRTVEIPENCSVGERTFGHCKNLTSVKLPHKAKINWHAFHECPSLEAVYAPEDGEYQQFYKRLPDACRVLNLDGMEVPGMRLKLQQWDADVPQEALQDFEKLQGLPLEEQLLHCYIVENSSKESCSYGESDGKVTRESRIPLTKDYDFDTLLVKNGTVAGFISIKGKTIFLGQICQSYSSVDTDGTGSTYSSSVSRLKVMDL